MKTLLTSTASLLLASFASAQPLAPATDPATAVFTQLSQNSTVAEIGALHHALAASPAMLPAGFLLTAALALGFVAWLKQRPSPVILPRSAARNSPRGFGRGDRGARPRPVFSQTRLAWTAIL